MTGNPEPFTAEIEWAEEERDYAQQRLMDFKRGERHSRGPSGGPFRDVTDEHRAQYELTIKRMNKLIESYKRLREERLRDA